MGDLHVGAFGGGVAREGSSDAQRTDELRACDSYRIGPRGQLIPTSDLSNGMFVADTSGAALMARLYAVAGFSVPANPQVVFIGDNALIAITVRVQNPQTGANITSFDITTLLATLTNGLSVTTAVFSGGGDDAGTRQMLICVGARSFVYPAGAPGLYLLEETSGGSFTFEPISAYDALGTGAQSLDGIVGTKAKQLFPRGVIAYNGHAFIWGTDASDTLKESANRIMFCNIGQVKKWGFDPAEADDTLIGTDRDFEDSDAISIAGAGAAIRAALVWAGKLWFGCTNGLYYVEGYGRESFSTNGAVAVRESKNTIGPHCLIEGPDGLPYGIGTVEGLWRFNGSETESLGAKLIDFDGASIDWWSLIWTDPTVTLADYPGRTNQDLVWMYADEEFRQVVTVIPFCNATLGYGAGTDTVVIYYHVATGGFTRQVFLGKTITAGMVFKRETSAQTMRLVTDTQDVTARAFRLGYSTPAASAVMPTAKPDVTFGEYAPFGPDGVGTLGRRYLTLSWASAASLPLVFTITPTVDGQVRSPLTLTIGATEPSTPADGDVWVDTSGTDTNLGNGTAGALVLANPADFLVKAWRSTWSKWVFMGGGQQGRRATIPISFMAMRGTRFLLRMQLVSAGGRYQIEGFGMNAKGGQGL